MEKPDSRGNTVVAALMLVALVGVAATVLDSARLANIRSQVAEVGSAVDRGYEAPKTDADKSNNNVRKDCKVGYDYIVRPEKAKAGASATDAKSKVSATLDGKTAVTDDVGNQCPKGITTPPTPSKQDPKRICDADWACKVFICRPIGALSQAEKKELTPTEEKNGEQCSFLGSCRAGAACDMSKMYTNDVKPRVERILRDPNASAADQRIARELLPTLDKETQKGVLGAFDEDKLKAKGALDDARADYEAAKKKADESCLINWGWGDPLTTCGKALTAKNEAEANLKEKEQYYNHLANQAKSLDEVKKTLDPSSSECVGERCILDSKTGKLKLDDRFDPTKNKKNTTFEEKPPPGNPGPQNPGGCQGGNCGGGGGGGGNPLGQLAPLLGSLLGNLLQPEPSCKLTASPTNVAPGQPVQLSWTSQNVQSAYLSSSGQVGPTGSVTVNPQQTTTYTMQVVGYPQQQQQQQYNPYGQQQGQYVWNPQLGAYVYMQAQQQPYGSPYGQQGGPPKQAQCTVQVTVGAQQNTGGGSGSGKPVAQISCQPKIADVGMQVAISYACQNANASKGEGFSTDNQLSGSTAAQVASPPAGVSTATYGLTCSKEGQTDSAQCTVQVNKPSIVLVANPKQVKSGESTNIGWVTGAMEKCTISSPTLQNFTSENAGNTSVSGVVKTPNLTQNTKFVLTCTTKSGGTKTADVAVEIK